jgi:hypothetical protein
MTTAFHPPLIQPTDLSEARAVNQRLAAMDHPDVTTTFGLAAMRATPPRDATAPIPDLITVAGDGGSRNGPVLPDGPGPATDRTSPISARETDGGRWLGCSRSWRRLNRAGSPP